MYVLYYCYPLGPGEFILCYILFYMLYYEFYTINLLLLCIIKARVRDIERTIHSQEIIAEKGDSPGWTAPYSAMENPHNHVGH